MKVATTDLSLGDVLEDGARVVGREGNGVVLARKASDGWSREIRWIFDWKDGSPKEVSLLRRLEPCSVCGEGSTRGVHDTCATPRTGPTLEKAIDALLMLGGRLVTPAAIGEMGPWHPKLAGVQFTYFDLETTGLHRVNDRIVELAAIRFSVAGEIARMESLVNPGFPIPESSTAIHGIHDEDVVGAPDEHDVLSRFAAFAKDSVLIAHNAEFDISFVANGADRCGVEFDVAAVRDTLLMSRGRPGKPGLVSRDEVENYKLGTLAATFGIPHRSAHRAMGDVEAGVGLFDFLLRRKYRREVLAA